MAEWDVLKIVIKLSDFIFASGSFPNATNPDVKIKLLRLVTTVRTFHSSNYHSWPPVAEYNASVSRVRAKRKRQRPRFAGK